MNTFLGELSTFNDIQYARYRVAFKLRKLQKSFLFDDVDITILQEGLHLGGVEPLARSAVISTSQLLTAIQELYSSLRSHQPILSSAQVKQAQDLCSNWLQMNYQCATGGKVHVGSLKLTLCLLTGTKEADKARYMFSVLANARGSVELSDVAYFCNVTQQLARTLQEDMLANWEGPERFWRESLKSVRLADDIEDEEFDGGEIKRQWLSQFEFIKVFSTQPLPHYLAWWDLFHHVKMLGKIVHTVRCSACARKPMVSYRYQCTECNNFSLCQMCFLKGKMAGTHKDSHRMLEITVSSKSHKSWKNRLLGAGNHDGRIWDEPKSPFVFSPRSSVSSFGSSGDHTDASSALSDMLASSQQQKSATSLEVHKPTMIRIGSNSSKNHVITTPQQPATAPPHGQLKRLSLSTSGSGSPDSISSSGVKFNYEGPRANHSRTTSSSSCNDSLHSGTNSDIKMSHLSTSSLSPARVRPSSTQQLSVKVMEDELDEINKRLSMEVDSLLSDITSSMEAIPQPEKLTIPPISPAHYQLRHRRGHSLQHLKLEETELEKDVTDLSNKREELTEELEGLISQVQNLHSRSLSLSNGLRVAPSINISPLVAPTHPRCDSLPAEAYTGQNSLGPSPMPSVSPVTGLSSVPGQTSMLRGHSPLVHRKVSPTQMEDQFDGSCTSSPVHYRGPSDLYSSQDQISDDILDILSEYDKTNSSHQSNPQLSLDL